MTIYLMGVLVMISLALIVYAMWPKKAEDESVIQRRMRGQTAQSAVAGSRAPEQASLAKRVMETVAPIAIRPVMINDPDRMSKLRGKLAMAGLRGEKAATLFLSSKTVVALLATVLAIAYSISNGKGVSGAAGLALFCAAMGFMAPNLWLSLAVSRRGEAVRNGLPDTLDLLVISVESGLGLDAAIQRVADEMRRVHPAIAEEMQIVTLESQMGIPRSEALMHFHDRTGLPEVKSLVAIVNQAERFGTSIARALRNQSDTLRVRRRQRAEERAQKTTVKLLFPLLFFIFPAILVVLGGPAFMRMWEALKSTPDLGAGFG